MPRPFKKLSWDYPELIKTLPGFDPYEDSDGYHFDVQAAERYVRWYPNNLKHSKGKGRGKPFYLTEHQAAITANLFGWYEDETGLRRFREVLYYVAKKAGKTTWSASTVLAVMSLEAEDLGRAELYQCASTKEQAALAFEHVCGFLEQNEVLADRFTVYGARGGSIHRQIRHKQTGAFWKCVSADAGAQDGVSPAMACIDELHRHKSSDLCEIMQKSTAAQPEPLIIYTTTADSNRPESVCNQLRHYGKQVCSGAVKDPRFLPAIYECSEDDDWMDPEVWKKANPNMGVTVDEDFLRREANRAKESPINLNNFLRLHLNIITNSDEAWFVKEDWDACKATRDKSNRVCFAGLDLSSHSDLTALVLYFPEDNGLECFFWVPRERAEHRQRRDKVPYITWGKAGHVELTEGNMIDTRHIRKKVNELGAQYEIASIGIDPWNAMDVSAQLQDDGFNVEFVRQGYPSLSSPSKQLDTLVTTKELKHGGNPVLTWMASNVRLVRDPAGNIRPAKDKSFEKIDGIVALVMAIGQAAATVQTASVYEERGMLIL